MDRSRLSPAEPPNADEVFAEHAESAGVDDRAVLMGQDPRRAPREEAAIPTRQPSFHPWDPSTGLARDHVRQSLQLSLISAGDTLVTMAFLNCPPHLWAMFPVAKHGRKSRVTDAAPSGRFALHFGWIIKHSLPESVPPTSEPLLTHSAAVSRSAGLSCIMIWGQSHCEIFLGYSSRWCRAFLECFPFWP